MQWAAVHLKLSDDKGRLPSLALCIGPSPVSGVTGVGVKSNRIVTIHGALHPAAGHPANKAVVSSIQPLAEGDLEWAGCVTVCGRVRP